MEEEMEQERRSKKALAHGAQTISDKLYQNFVFVLPTKFI